MINQNLIEEFVITLLKDQAHKEIIREVVLECFSILLKEDLMMAQDLLNDLVDTEMEASQESISEIDCGCGNSVENNESFEEQELLHFKFNHSSPLEEATLSQLLLFERDGLLSKDSLVWKEGMYDWVSAEEFLSDFTY